MARAGRSVAAGCCGGLFLLALVVGAGSGLGAVVFRDLIYFFTWLATVHYQFGQQGRVPSCSPALARPGVLRGHPGHQADLCRCRLGERATASARTDDDRGRR